MSRHLILPATVVSVTLMALLTPTPPMTEAEAIAERDRLQKIHTYLPSIWDKGVQKHIDKTISGAANWTAAGCADPAFNGCATTWSICCEGESTGSAPWTKRSKCEDVEGHDGCAFHCGDPTHAKYAAECTAAGYEGSSVCGTDSAGNEVPSWPMVREECSTGPTHELDGYWEETITDPTTGSESEIKHVTPKSSFYDDVNANTQVPDGADADTVLGKWSKNVLGWAVLTNAANATSRATVTIEPHAELVMSYKAKNNGKMIVNGSWKTHFIVIDPTNYGNGAAQGDGLSILGGDFVCLGATSMGSLNSTTNGSARMHNIVNSGNVNSKGSTDMFMSNVVSSGNVLVEATSSTDKRVLYNVTATAGTITVVGGLFAIYSVEAQAAVVMSVTGGSHFISNTTNAGTLSVNSCTYVNMYNVNNTGNVTASCTTVYGRKLENSGNVTFTSGDLDIEIVANTGTVEVSTGVTGVIATPCGTTLNVPSTVTVTYTGTCAAAPTPPTPAPTAVPPTPTPTPLPPGATPSPSTNAPPSPPTPPTPAPTTTTTTATTATPTLTTATSGASSTTTAATSAGNQGQNTDLIVFTVTAKGGGTISDTEKQTILGKVATKIRVAVSDLEVVANSNSSELSFRVTGANSGTAVAGLIYYQSKPAEMDAMGLGSMGYAAPAPPAPADEGLDSDLVLGIIIGSSCLVVILAVAVGVFVMKKKKGSSGKSTEETKRQRGGGATRPPEGGVALAALSQPLTQQEQPAASPDEDDLL